MDSADVVVIGAGVIGLAIAREFALRGREVLPAYAPVCAERGLVTLAIDSWCFSGRQHEADGRLGEHDLLSDTIAGLAKMNNASRARQVIAQARDLLGGNGILLSYHVARHFADMEAIYTYEGTDHMQMLVVGKEICGVSAFK